MEKKRENFLSWDDYFMAVAFLSSQRSKDPSTQVGACIVNADLKIVGIGYNGLPQKCSDDEFPWNRTSESKDPLDTKYPFVCHAGCKMYVALFPCNECAKLIIQSGIKEIVYYSDKYHDEWPFRASRKMLDAAGIKYWQHKPKQDTIVIDFKSIESSSISSKNAEEYQKQRIETNSNK